MTSSHHKIQILKIFNKVYMQLIWEYIFENFLYHMPLEEVPLVTMEQVVTTNTNLLIIHPLIIAVERGWMKYTCTLMLPRWSQKYTTDLPDFTIDTKFLKQILLLLRPFFNKFVAVASRMILLGKKFYE